MAKNGTKGGGRQGAIRGRTQYLLPNGHYAKRDRKTGEILAIKSDFRPFKGVVIEKKPQAHCSALDADGELDVVPQLTLADAAD